MFILFNIDYGVRPTGYQVGKSFKVVPEMIPEIVVPDLTGFKVLLVYNHFRMFVDNDDL